MAIEISCSNCGKGFRARDEAAGKSFKCKSCGTTIDIPYEDDEFEAEVELPPPRRRFPDADAADERPRRRMRTSARAAGNTLGPAIGLYLTAGLWFFLTFVFGMLQLLNPQPNPKPPDGVNQAAYQFGYVLGQYGATFGWPLISLFILAGAFCLQTRRMYALALTACIAASIPCCSPVFILGMPFGIWGIAVMLNDEVKRSFE